MSERNMRIVFSSGITNLVERNSSFDSGVLRVAYTGRNRNNSFIGKDTFELCMPTIYNCPIVCRYDRETDTIGAHDMELVSDDNGMHVVNLTQPVGVVPESAKYWWEEIEDDSGVHEYLCIEVLIWKRQEAYRKIKEDGITDESMEISVKEGSIVDGVYVIKRFEFTAFCLLGTAEPCYESASLEMFSREDFKQQLAKMMQDFKESFSLISTQTGVEDKQTQNLTEGGEEVLDQKMDLLAEYGLSADDLEFSLEELTYEELKAELSKIQAAADDDAEDDSQNEEDKAGEAEPAQEPAEEQAAAEEAGEPDVSDEPHEDDASFALMGEQFREELVNALSVETVETCFGEMARYWYVDYSTELSEVYCYDMEDWKLYGFTYSMNGDNVVVDFECKKRKKFSIVDFDEGDQTAMFSAVFATMTEKYQAASDTISSMETELGELRKFKEDTEDAIAKSEREKVFDRFEDLIGVEAFEQLREDCAGIDAETLEEKCYAIRGRYGTSAKFSLEENKVPKLKVPKTSVTPEPYNGVFTEYGINPKQ